MTYKWSFIIASTTNLQPYTLETKRLGCETNDSQDKSQPQCEAELTLHWNLATRAAVAILVLSSRVFFPLQTFSGVRSDGDQTQTFLWLWLLPEEN